MISVCLATFNGEKFIKDQIHSILDQLDENDELIISDDGSTDRTLEIISSIKDRRIKIYYNNSRCYTKNFENALNHANGDFIFLSDQDDIWMDNKVRITMQYLEKYDFVMSNAKIVDENLRVITESRNNLLNVKNGFIKNFIKSYYLGCCMAFNKKVLDVSLPFPNNHSLCFHDSWISLISELYFKTYVCDESLILYRRHTQNISHGGLKKEWAIINSIKIRCYLLFQLIKRVYMVKNKYGKMHKYIQKI